MHKICFSIVLVSAGAILMAAGKIPADTMVAGTCWPMWRQNSEHTGYSPYKGTDVPFPLWEISLKGSCETGLTVGPDGNLFFGTSKGRIYAVTPLGELLWYYETQGPIRGQPLIDVSGILYLGSLDETLYAIDTEDGILLWAFTTDNSIASSPNMDEVGNIYFGCHDNNVYCLYPGGTLKWKTNLSGAISTSSPTISPDGYVYVAGYSTGLVKLDKSDGDIEWIFDAVSGALRNTPALGDDGSIYIGSRNGTFYAVTPDGQEKWSYETGGEIRSSAAIGPDGTIYFGSYDSEIYALNPDTGTLVWSAYGGGPVDGSPCVDSDGVVYAGGMVGPYRAYNSDGSVKFTFGPKILNGCVSVDANGNLYAGGEFSLCAYGWPRPEALLSVNKTNFYHGDEIELEVEYTNSASFSYNVDIKIWKLGPDRTEEEIVSTYGEIFDAGFESSLEVYSHIFDKNDPGGNYCLGAKLLDHDTGEILSEDKLIIYFNETISGDHYSDK